MNTIEERAKEYADNKASEWLDDTCRQAVWDKEYKAYISIAKEQKAIDDAEYGKDKVLIATKRRLIDMLKRAFEESKSVGLCRTYQWYQGMFNEFIKAMEE